MTLEKFVVQILHALHEGGKLSDNRPQTKLIVNPFSTVFTDPTERQWEKEERERLLLSRQSVRIDLSMPVSDFVCGTPKMMTRKSDEIRPLTGK